MNTDNRRFLVVTALVVVIAVGMTIPYAGTTVAADVDRGDSSPNEYGGWDTATGSGDVGDGATVYRGEGDITFIDNGEGPGSSGEEVTPAELHKVSGSEAGTTLEVPIPEDQPAGTYSTDGESLDGDNFGVVVKPAHIYDFDLNNDEGIDTLREQISQNNSEAEVAVNYNFTEAEDITVTVEDEGGLDVTDEFIEGETTRNDRDVDASGHDVVFGVVDLEDIEPGQYTITVEGSDDLNHGKAARSATVTVVNEVEATLSFEESNETRSDPVSFSVADARAEDDHLVTLDREYYRDDEIAVGEAADIFLFDVGYDVEERGIVTANTVSRADTSANVHTLAELEAANLENQSVASFESTHDTEILYSYAIVDRDGEGVMSTEHVKTDTVSATLYEQAEPLIDGGELNDPQSNPGDPVDIYGVEVSDEASVTIEDISLSLTSPQSPYIVGSEVTVGGTASAPIEEVVLYARDSGDWERVTDPITVGIDDGFEEAEFDLSSDARSTDIFSVPGSYRIGVLAATDADVDDDGTVEDTITPREFAGFTRSTLPIRARDGGLDAQFRAVDGQVALEDGTVSVLGTASGQEVVDIVLVGSRGYVQHDTLDVDENGSFADTDVGIESDQLARGTVTAYVLAPGNDGTYARSSHGAGSLPDVDGVPDAGSHGLTPSQINDSIVDSTAGAPGSDDLLVTTEFRLADGLTVIDSVHPENATDDAPGEVGEPIVVEGSTNRKPEGNTITVELLGSNGESITLTSTAKWDADGRWSVTFEPTDVEPGTYVVESGDGTTFDRLEFQLVAQRETETPAASTLTPESTPTVTPIPEQTATPESNAETPSVETFTPAVTPGQDGPGFGLVVAVVVVLGTLAAAVRTRLKE